MTLTGKTAIVTGASSAIGRAIAIAFAAEGASVVIADIQEHSRVDSEERPTEEVIEAAGGTATFIETDVADEESVQTMVDETVETFGGIDIVVNNAGITSDGAIDGLDMDDWNRIQSVNVVGVVNVSKATIPHLREKEQGRIINIASQRGLRGGATTEKAAYVASKGAVVSLTQQMALDYGPEGIAVNAICPGPVESGMTEIGSDDDRDALLEGIVTPFVGQPSDISPAAVLLAGDGGRYIHGHALVVDGGYLIK